ncbi:cytochrome P450 [Nocardioides zeae]|nr:cytochrome P450 [Nocardioides zeae]
MTQGGDATGSPVCPVAHDSAAFDPYDPTLGEPGVWAVYEEVRAAGPVARSEERGGFWTLTGFDDVRTALRDHETYASGWGHRLPTDGSHRSIPIDTDPPLHTHYRTIMGLALSPARIRDMAPFLRQMVSTIVDDYAREGGGDAVRAISLAIPLQVLTELVGFSQHTVNRFRELTEEMWSRVPQVPFAEARASIFDLMAEEVERHRQEPADDFVDALLGATVGDRPIEDDERLRVLGTLAVAGHESTMNAISMLLWTLATHEEEQSALRADPSLAPKYIEELLRLRTPVQNIARRATCPVDVAGQRIDEGDSVLLSYAAANRDPAKFDRPTEFVPGRSERGHLGFGWGIHQCMGAALVRSELTMLLEELCKRPPLRLDGEVEWSPLQGGTHLGPARLPLRFEGA